MMATRSGRAVVASRSMTSPYRDQPELSEGAASIGAGVQSDPSHRGRRVRRRARGAIVTLVDHPAGHSDTGRSFLPRPRCCRGGSIKQAAYAWQGQPAEVWELDWTRTPGRSPGLGVDLVGVAGQHSEVVS